MKMLNRLSNAVFDTQEVTEEAIDYYEKHPDELDLIINREHFNAMYLGFIFALGISLTVLSRVAAYFYGDYLGEFVNSVILDVISEIGIAIFGGAVVAYLIESLNKKQYQQNIKYRREMKAILDKRKKDAAQ
ncbi:MAG: hypothetical protein AAGC88_08335 [Bacteroidota bacterium]